jgi:hypothetical protein
MGREKTNFAQNREKKLIEEIFSVIEIDSLGLTNNPIIEKRDNFIIIHEIDPHFRLKGADGINGISGYIVSNEGVWISFQRHFELQKADYTVLERVCYLIDWSRELQKEEKIFAQTFKNIFFIHSEEKISLNSTELVQIVADTMIVCNKKIIKQKLRPKTFIDLIPYQKELEDNNQALEQIYRRIKTMEREKTINPTPGGAKP